MTPDDRASTRLPGVGPAGRLNLEPIRSQANPLIKDIRSLQQRRKRYQERAFVVEGVRLVQDVLASGIAPRHILLREDVAADLLPLLPGDLHPRVRVADERTFASLSDVPHPQGILAVVPMREPASDALQGLEAPLVVVIAGVRDPGNLGTLLRSAAGAGVDHVFLTDDSVDPYNPKVVRAGMGCHFRVNFSPVDADTLANVLSSCGVIGLAEADGELSYESVDWTGSSAIIVGGEAAGASEDVRSLATARIRIPLAHGVESLNAAVAGSLLMFEAARQRRARSQSR